MADNSKQERIEEIFHKACDIPAADREEFLSRECGDDSEIRQEVEKLLAADQQLRSDNQILPDPPDSAVIKEIQQVAEEGIAEAEEKQASAADRNLLYGIIALQMNFINRNALIQAMNAWVLNKTKPIEDILVSQGDMGENTNLLLTALVDKHLEHHNNNPEKSLASLNAVGDLKEELNVIDDQELDQSIVHLGSESTPLYPDIPTVTFGDSSKDGGRFRVLRPHSKGGLGAVSVAKDEELNREVALKEVLEKYAKNQSARDRLRVEAEITGGLEHPGIVPVYGLGSYEDGSPFYCMRFIKGDSLKDAIKDFQNSKASLSATERNLKLRNLLRRFVDVCEAVSYAHSRSVLHRDLKPGNIMLGKYGETLVVDWGLAKATGQEAAEELSLTADPPLMPRSGDTGAPTIPGTAIGTPQYMSPEQAEGRLDQLGPATDVYSLGATMYCLLVGHAPIEDREPEVALRKARNGDFSRPRTKDGKIPKPLEAICLKAMALSPNDRYATALGLAEDVERWLADEPVGAFQEPWLVGVGRTIRKNRTLAATLLGILITSILGLTVANIITQNKNAEIAKKNERLLNLTAKLEDSRDSLNKNYESFRKLTGTLIRKAEKELSQKPEWIPIREWLTHETLETYSRFKEDNPELDWLKDSTDSQIWLSRLFRYEANVLRNGNDLKNAIRNYQESISILKGVLDREPASPPGIGFLSETLRDFANTLKMTGELNNARKRIDESIRLSDSLLSKYPESINSQRLKATNLSDAIVIYSELGTDDRAQELSSVSLEIWQPIIEIEKPRELDFQLYCLTLIRESACLRVQQKLNNARESASEALRIARGMSEATSREARYLLARSLLEKVLVQNESETASDESEKLIVEACSLLSELNREFPDFKHYSQYLAASLAEYGKLLSMRGDEEQATSQFEKALAAARISELETENHSKTMEVLGDVLLDYARHIYSDDKKKRSLELATESTEKFTNALELNQSSGRLKEKLNQVIKFTDFLRDGE